MIYQEHVISNPFFFFLEEVKRCPLYQGFAVHFYKLASDYSLFAISVH